MFIVVVRTFILYIVVVFGMRLMGKRQLGQLQPNELVVTILISNVATWSIEDSSIPVVVGVLPILLFVCFEVLMSYVTLKFPSIRKIVTGTPIVVIHEGQILQEKLKELRYSADDLIAELRNMQIFDVRDVQCAIVETGGSLSVYQKYQKKPVTPEILQIPGHDYVPLIAVSDGRVLHASLQSCNLTEQWLNGILEENGYKLKDVFLMLCNSNKEFFIVPKEQG